MIEAEIRNKIRQQQHISTQEDVLTSNIFGLLSLIDTHLMNILSCAKSVHSEEKADFLKTNSIDGDLEFWRTFENKNENNDKKRDEPDVYFKTKNNQKIIVEVKYFSDESSESQLEDYARHCDALIYLTPDNNMAAETVKKYRDNEKIFWLSWEQFCQESAMLMNEVGGLEKKILSMVYRYLEYKGLKYWNGWRIDTEEQVYSCQFYSREYFYIFKEPIAIGYTKFYQGE